MSESNPLRLAVDFPHPTGGQFSHFAHFVSDFALPLYALLHKERMTSRQGSRDVTLELAPMPANELGPMRPLAEAIFPGLKIEYPVKFSHPPHRFERQRWHSDPTDIAHFSQHLRQVLSVKPQPYGVIIVRRGQDRARYPGNTFLLRSGADRRAIGFGFDDLVAAVKAIRPDTIVAELEHLPFAEQFSLFLGSDTLIAQHGAAFAHAHWMPPGGTLIELHDHQPRGHGRMVQTFARLCGHRAHTLAFPSEIDQDDRLILHLDDVGKVLAVLPAKPRSATTASA